MTRKRYDEVLNRILYHPAYDPEDFIVIYKHRGTPHNLRILRVSGLARVTGGYLVLHGGSKIPLTRIVQIRDRRTGEILAGDERALDKEVVDDLLSEPSVSGIGASKPKEEEKPGAAPRPQSQGITVAVRAAYPERGEYSWTESLLPFTDVGAVEVAFLDPHLFLNNVRIREVVAPFSKLPIKTASVHMAHARITEPDAFIETLKKTVQIAKILDCPLIVVHPSKGRLPDADAFFAHRVDPLLKAVGVLLCWETFASKRRFLSGIEGIAAFCEGRRWHRACYDTSHLFKPQNEILEDFRRYVPKVTRVLHFSNRVAAQREQHLPLRHPEGDLEFEEILKGIKESNFSGTITLEYLKEHHDHLVEDALWVKERLGVSSIKQLAAL
jgi:hypothetical protein